MTRIGDTEVTSEGKEADDYNHGESVEKSGPNSIAAATIRSSLGFLAARRRLVLPDVGLDDEMEKTGHLAALAVVDRFGFVLLSCASGMRQHHLSLCLQDAGLLRSVLEGWLLSVGGLGPVETCARCRFIG